MFYEDYWLTNVTLESGFVYHDNLVVHTNTEIFDIKIHRGKITTIKSCSQRIPDSLPHIDCNKYLALPAFKEMHCHPDKTFLTQKWEAPRAIKIPEIIQIESDLMANTDYSLMEHRAFVMIESMKRTGTLFIRAHADVHDKVNLKNVHSVSNALRNQKCLLGYEIVAFPQCGLLKGNTIQLMVEALQNGATIVGGIDPHTIEGNADKALHIMIQLAIDHNAGIDLHLHEMGVEGLRSIEKLAALTIEARLQGRVAISHAFVLGSASDKEVVQAAEKMNEAQIEIITCGLVSDPIPKISLLNRCGVNVRLGSDNIYDSWNPFGNGDLMERLGRVCQVFEWYDEYSLSRSLRLITGGIVPLSDDGKRIWPSIGADVAIILVDATCSAEAIARRKDRKMASVYIRQHL
jgi:cytosine/adenosine deaminase-related metal-dependent hydrolase